MRYSYEVDGVSHQGRRISFGHGGGPTRSEMALHQKLSQARRVQARYNPANPEESTLVTGIQAHQLGSLGCGCTFLLFMVGFVFAVCLMGRADQSTPRWTRIGAKLTGLLFLLSLLLAFVMHAKVQTDDALVQGVAVLN